MPSPRTRARPKPTPPPPPPDRGDDGAIRVRGARQHNLRALDLDKLGAWLDERALGEAGSPVEIRELSGGIQNVIYEIRREGLHAALRMPPPQAPEARDEGIKREWRIIEALDGTDVPHTEAIAVCTDPGVLGRTFYLMGFVDGWSPMGLENRAWPAPFDTDLEARKGLAFELVEGIARLGNVDWRAKGLHDLGRPEGFHERQVDRWTAFLERIKGRISHRALDKISPLAVPVLLEIGREGVMGEAIEEILRRESDLVAEAGLAELDDPDA